MIFICSHRWERRTDSRGRVYYVDHNTRTTTWQRPNTESLSNYASWQEWRGGRTLEQFGQRFLFPQQPGPAPDNDPLGPLPEGWGTSFFFFLKRICYSQIQISLVFIAILTHLLC